MTTPYTSAVRHLLPRGPVTWIAVCMCALSACAFGDDLYSQDRYDALAADHRALRVGDNLTVVVTEITSASSDARTTTDKTGAVSGSMNLHARPQEATFNVTNTFDGGGTTERSDKLVARLTTVVQSVDRSGKLRVKGAQEILVNGERQRLLVEGWVRPEDIGPDNTVLSSRLSDSKISYTGRGVLTESQRPGLFTRILSWLRVF